MEERLVLSVLVKNHSGVLSRVAGLFSRRGYNIDSLTVGETEDHEISRMTITVHGDHNVLEQIEKQLNKLVEVVHIQVLASQSSVSREMALIKLASPIEKRASIIELSDIFRAKIVDVSPDALMLEITGSQDKVNAFIDLVKPYGIKEMVRAGLTALGRGSSTLIDNMKEGEE